jgi:hypothetical protein
MWRLADANHPPLTTTQRNHEFFRQRLSMPEAFAVLFIFVVAVASYVGAKLHVANPANHDPMAELARLREQRSSLVTRLQLARREKWEPEMQERILQELTQTETLLAQQSDPAEKPMQETAKRGLLPFQHEQ